MEMKELLKAAGKMPVSDAEYALLGDAVDRRTTRIYGWHIDPAVSDPAQAVTYLEDAVGKSPAAMGAERFSYGGWARAFFMPKPCMLRYDGTVAYYLDPDDYTRKRDGTPSDIANADFEGNAMMEWPLIWYKFAAGESDGEGYFYCSDKQIDSSYKCWCSYDADNNIIPHFYTAIYNGTGTSKLRSLSGVQLTAGNGNGNTTAAQEMERAAANNTSLKKNWNVEVLADRLLINALLVLMGKTLDTKSAFGNGLAPEDQAQKEQYVTGSLNDKGLFYGSHTDHSSAVKVFGMENWWGCVFRRTAGLICSGRRYHIKLTSGTADGSAVNGYSFSSHSGYIVLQGHSPAEPGYIKKMMFSPRGFFASGNGGSAATYYCSWIAYWNNEEIYHALSGGMRSDRSGAFETDYTSPGASSYTISSSLSCKPSAGH